jgi:hypothetical protein
LSRFWRLKTMVDQERVDGALLSEWQGRMNLFPDLDYRVFTG